MHDLKYTPAVALASVILAPVVLAPTSAAPEKRSGTVRSRGPAHRADQIQGTGENG